MTRPGPKGRVYVAINSTGMAQTARLPAPMRDLLAGGTVSTVTLNRYEVAVVAP